MGKSDESSAGASPVASELANRQRLIATAYNRFIEHTRSCGPCSARGVDCEEAVRLKSIWRAARSQ